MEGILKEQCLMAEAQRNHLQRRSSDSTLSRSRRLQRKCACGKESIGIECEECRKEKQILRRRAVNESEHGEVPPIVYEVLRSPGKPMDAQTRTFMESRFGQDFGHIRLSRDARATESARAINARAYTVGNRIVFDAGQYSPSTKGGAELLAHELTHALQQGARFTAGSALHLAPPDDASEILAQRAAAEFSAGRSPGHVSPRGLTVNRDIRMPDSRRRQTACVKRQGGCASTRDGGTVPMEDIIRYNAECQKESNYAGGDVIPTDEECKTDLERPSSGNGLSTGEKLWKAIEHSEQFLKPELWSRVKEFFSPASIGALVIFTTLYVISQTTPIGWLADVLAVGLILATVVMVGPELVEIIKELIQFGKIATNATSDKEFDEAGHHFAIALTKAGIDIAAAILLHRTAKAANLKPIGPRSPGLLEALKAPSGEKVTTPRGAVSANADVISGDGQVSQIPAKDVPGVAASDVPGKGGKAASVNPKDPAYKEKWLNEKSPTSKQPKSIEKMLAENKPWSSIEVFEALKRHIAELRKQSGISRIDLPKAGNVPAPPVKGGTLASVKTDVTGLRGRFFDGASSNALPEGAKGQSGTTAGDLKAVNPLAGNHAEAVALENLGNELNKLSDAEMVGKNVWVLIEQEPCSSCASGIGTDATPGPIKQFSLAYPDLVVEIHNIRTSRSYFLRGGNIIQ